MREQALGFNIKIRVNDELVVEYEEDKSKKCYFTIQYHNPGMTFDAKDLDYKNLSK